MSIKYWIKKENSVNLQIYSAIKKNQTIKLTSKLIEMEVENNHPEQDDQDPQRQKMVCTVLYGDVSF